MRDLFLLDPDVIFLNHGSFGATPKPVFETYQRWQLELERQPVEFLGRRYHALMDEVRGELGRYLDADPDDLILVPNATTGINTIARSLNLAPNDEILATDHEYGAVDNTWQFIAEQNSAHYIRQPIALPVDSEKSVIDQLWAGVTPRTKVIAISHITSSTALIFPIKAICERARLEGILTVIDGAHVPGQIPLNLSDLGADFYAGNCHKWLCAPKGSAFLYVRREHHDTVNPLIVSWGWRGTPDTLANRNGWQGTRDIAAFLSIPSAIKFQREHDWHDVRERCHLLAVRTRERVTALTGLPPIAPDWWFAQMFSVTLPAGNDDLKDSLYRRYRIELPIITWNEQTVMRVSFQGYNTTDDSDALINALRDTLNAL